MYVLAYHKKTDKRTHSVRIPIITDYNHALLLLDRFELGADPMVNYHGYESVMSKDLRDNPSYGGLQGRTGKNGARIHTLDSADALSAGTHYSLYAPHIENLPPDRPLQLREAGMMQKMGARLATLFGRRAGHINILRTRKQHHDFYGPQGKKLSRQVYYVARQDILNGLWDIALCERAGNDSEASPLSFEGTHLTEADMFKKMMAWERFLISQMRNMPATTRMETTDEATRWHAGEHALYYGRFLPSIAHEILAMRDLSYDENRRPNVIGSPQNRPLP